MDLFDRIGQAPFWEAIRRSLGGEEAEEAPPPAVKRKPEPAVAIAVVGEAEAAGGAGTAPAPVAAAVLDVAADAGPRSGRTDLEAAAEPLVVAPPGALADAGRPTAAAAGGGTRFPRVVAVIPAYNEEQTLPEVIRAARAVPEIAEVIVVSDGSTDSTPAVARTHGAICIELSQNVGKGGAMKAGIDRADADVYVFLDADLIGVTPAHIQAMMRPVLRAETDVVIAQLDGGRVATDLASVVAPNLSGQRVVTRRLLQGMSGMETTRFGVEIAMKRYIKRQGIPVVRVPLGISHRTKEEKMGLLRGFLARMKEYWEIVKIAGDDFPRQ